MAEPGAALADWLAHCAARGLRLTAPRTAILAALHEAGRPLDAVALFQLARPRHAGLSLGTVYRLLRELETLALARPEAQPHGRTRWSLPGATAAGDDEAVALLARLAARLGYRLLPDSAPSS